MLKKIDICSDRLEREIYLFSKCHAIATYACEHITIFNYLISKDKEDIECIILSLDDLHNSAKDLSDFIDSIKVHKLDLPGDKHQVLKEANLILENAVLRFDETRKLLTTEFYAGDAIIIEVTERLKNLITSINNGEDINIHLPEDIIQYIESFEPGESCEESRPDI